MRNNVVKKVLAATLACMMTFSMTTVAQAKGDKNSDKEITIGNCLVKRLDKYLALINKIFSTVLKD